MKISEMQASGQNFCGVFMGDYCRTAISTRLTCGTVIAVACHIFEHGAVPVFLPSFSYGLNAQMKMDHLHLANSRFASLKGDPKKGLFLIAKGIFYFAYLIQILLYIFKTSATELNVLRLAAASSLVYWQFSTGVHANHIFFLMPLAILLCWKKNEYLMPFTIIFLLVNLNLIRVLGYDGIGSGSWPDIIFGINPSLVLSFLAVASSFYLIGVLFRDSFYEEDKKKVHS